MSFWGWQEGEVVTTVSDGGVGDGHGVPQPGHRQVGSHEHWAGNYRGEVDHVVLERVAVNRGNTNRCRPLMVGLVEVPVKIAVMEQPGRKGRYVTHEYMIPLAQKGAGQ